MELISDDVAINGQNIKRLKRRSFFIMCTTLHTQVVKILILYVRTKIGLTFKSKVIRRKRNIQNYYSCRESECYLRLCEIAWSVILSAPHHFSWELPTLVRLFWWCWSRGCVLAITGLGTWQMLDAPLRFFWLPLPFFLKNQFCEPFPSFYELSG